MKDFIKMINDLPKLVKIILCIPVLDIIWAIYRIVKGIDKKNNVLLVLGILWIIPGAAFAWVVDLVTTILYDKPILTE